MPATQDQKRDDKPVTLVSHSAIFYWWPVWLLAIALALLTIFMGTEFSTTLGDEDIRMIRSATPGSIFAFLLFFVILINSIRFKKLASILVLGSAVVLLAVSAWAGWLDSAARYVPSLDIRMSAGFYLFFGFTVFLVWALNLFIFDRLVFWRIKDGYLQRVWPLNRVGESHDLTEITISKSSDDSLRHILFGFGSGDLTIQRTQAPFDTFQIRNVISVSEKLKRIKAEQFSVPGTDTKTVVVDE